jgi:ribonucleoside-triphosphate reductase
MNKSNKLLSDIVAFRTYAKHLPLIGRREALPETITRNMEMHIRKFPELEAEIRDAYFEVYALGVMPSMRSLQFGGIAIEKNNVRQYNCAFVHAKYTRVFAEILYVLLCGTGAGYSVQKRHTSQLPALRAPFRENKHLIHDSIEGWADAADALMNSFFHGGIKPVFDYSQITPKGVRLETTGSKAPGPEPLKIALELIETKLIAAVGRQLSPLEVHDIICILADCVLAGGIRRAALIALFDKDDEEMLTCKHGEWWIDHPYRARANNSAMLLRGATTWEEFKRIADACVASKAGEPGFYWTDDLETGANPCVEIGLRTNQFCNLTTVSMTGITDPAHFLRRVKAAAFIGTLQASYTFFPYLSEIWKKTTEEEALIGVSFTGIADNPAISSELLSEAAALVVATNQHYAKILGINPSARCTCLKPEGSASCVLGSSSGIHSRHNEEYLRRIRMNSNDPLAIYLMEVIPELVEPDFYGANTVVVTIPQQAPKGAIIQSQESALQLFERVLFYSDYWITPGYVSGPTSHNVSCTINYLDEEVVDLVKALWDNRDKYNGVSLLPKDLGTYKQAPFENCDLETFEKLEKLVQNIDLTQVREEEDGTERTGIIACSGGVCEIT